MDWALRKYRWWTGPGDNIHEHGQRDSGHGRGDILPLAFLVGGGHWREAYLMDALEGGVFDRCIRGGILGGLHLRGMHWRVMIRYFHGLKSKTKAGRLGFEFYLDRNQRVERDR